MKTAVTPELIHRVRWYVKIRWLYLLILSSVGVGAQYIVLGWDPIVIRDTFAALYALELNAFIHLLAYRAVNRQLYYQVLASTLIVFDTILASYFVYTHGGIASRTIILYAIPIIISGTLFGRKAIYLSTLLGITLYSSILLLQASGTISIVTVDVSALGNQYVLVPILFYASVLIIIALISDFLVGLTKRHEQEIAQEEIISLTSHQLRTPATAVKNLLSMALDNYVGALNREQKQLVEQAYEENERELHLVDTLLSMAQIEGMEGIRPVKTDLSKLVKEVVNTQSVLLERSKQNITISEPPEAVWARVDRAKIELALENLLNNAHKYTPPGGSINITIQQTVHSAIIRIQDSGVGIAPKDIKRLFRRYSRIESPLSKKVSGSGLGLYLVKKIVALHRGTIKVMSAPGQGSTFSIYLPR